MKTFRIQIRAYGYYADFTIESNDTPEDIEKAIVDKLGQNVIKWDSAGEFYGGTNYITYEEVQDASTLNRPLQTKEVLGVKLGTGAS